jgi:hypothetical protein
MKPPPGPVEHGAYYRIDVSIQIDDSWVPKYFHEPGAQAQSLFNIFRVTLELGVGGAGVTVPSFDASALGLPISTNKEMLAGPTAPGFGDNLAIGTSRSPGGDIQSMTLKTRFVERFSSIDHVVASLLFHFDCTFEVRSVEKTYVLDGFPFRIEQPTPFAAAYEEPGFKLDLTITEIDLAEYFISG